MIKKFVFNIWLFLIPATLLSQTEICSGSLNVMGGEYKVTNNVWGTGEGVGDQCITVDTDTSYFTVSLSTHNSNEVASYPFIHKGCHWGACTSVNNPFPLQVSEISSAPFTWHISTDSASGSWNAAFEAWFSASSTGSDYDGELMIWVDYNGIATPAGTNRGTVNIGGYNWSLYYSPWARWNYFTYKLIEPVSEISLDIKEFIHDATTRGYLFTSWYMHNMEAGFEIWSGGENLTSISYTADAVGGASPVDYPPSPFRLSTPYERSTLSSFTVPFSWETSIDPDEEDVTYTLYISGYDYDTTISDLTETSYSFEGDGKFTYDTTYSWYVEAFAGSQSRSSYTVRTFSIGSPDIVPDNYFSSSSVLSQNYPNPVRNYTTIEYNIAAPGHVQLRIFDILGNEVENLIDEYQPSDEYTVKLENISHAKGIYYYELKLNNITVGIKKMIVL